MHLFKGSGVALITPFDSYGNVDYDSLRRLIDFQISNGTDAIIVCGTTGEASTLSYDEHNKVIEECIKYVDGRIPVIAGTGSNCTKSAIKLSLCAEELGADGVLVVTPYYNGTTQDGLVRHYTNIANSISIPLILYNVPSRCGINIEPVTVASIVNNCDNVFSIKEASSNISQVAHIKSILGDKIDIYSGNDDQIVPVLSLGGVGVISVLANIMPRQVHDLVCDFLSGNLFSSRDSQLRYYKLIRELFSEKNPIGVKRALSLMGLIDGNLRLPLVEMSEEHSKSLALEMKKNGIL